MSKEIIFIWGTGYKAKLINLNYANELLRMGIEGYIDNDASKWGKEFYGKKIYSPEVLRQHESVSIFISIDKKTEVRKQLEDEFKDIHIRIIGERFLKKEKLLTRYSGSEDKEIKQIVEYLQGHTLTNFPYPFSEEHNRTMPVYKENGLFYVMHNGKKLYFSKAFDTEEKVMVYYHWLSVEQDQRSPHRYLSDDFYIEKDSVIIDAGAAEGFFSLDAVESAKKIYLIEPDSDWIEALNYTFKEYKDKVVIIDKCISNYTDDNTVLLDECINEVSVDFIKMDIEGEELYALRGAKRLISNSPSIKCAICSYHQEFAYHAIRDELKEMGFTVSHSDGYMWFDGQYNSMRPLTLRRGVVRAEKSQTDRSF